MIFVSSRLRVRGAVASGLICLFAASTAALSAQQPAHGRKYNPPPVTAHIVVTVEKEFNGKLMENAAVVFHAIKDGKDTGNMEVKTNSHGEATMDFIEAGSHVTVQVISSGYATYASEFDVTDADKLIEVKMRRPQAQISGYLDNDGKAATVSPGVQERQKPMPVAPTPAVPAAPAQTVPRQ